MHTKNAMRIGAALVGLGLLAACEGPVSTSPRSAGLRDLLSRSADSARIDNAIAAVGTRPLATTARTHHASFSQIAFIAKPEGVSGATTTALVVSRHGGRFTTVYNTIGDAIAGAVTFGDLRDGRLKNAHDVTTEDVEFSDARMLDADGGEMFYASGSARTGAGLDIRSPAVFLSSDLRESVRVFDLPSVNVTGFDLLSDGQVAAATGYEGSISLLDPNDQGSVRTIADGLPSLLGLDAADGSLHVTDVDGKVLTFDLSGSPTGSLDLPDALNPEERAEVSVCGSRTLVGAHTGGVVLFDGAGGMQTVDSDFGIGASMVPDCSAFAATTQGAVDVGVADGHGGFDLYRVDTVGGEPMPYASSVEIVPLTGDAAGLIGGRCPGDYLIVVSSSEGTHFITLDLP